MFTGIIQSVGTLSDLEAREGDQRLTIDAPELDPARMQLGDSIAVAGVCLTVAARTARGFIADVSRETLAQTTIGQWRVGERVNLEAALRANDALGGHLVLGHVDGRAELLDRHVDARSQRLRFRVPRSLQRYVARKGAVALDGVSLTVNEVDGRRFRRQPGALYAGVHDAGAIAAGRAGQPGGRSHGTLRRTTTGIQMTAEAAWN